MPEPGGWAPAWLDPLLRVAGGLVAVVAALVTGILELILATLRVGGQLIGVSVPLAVVANVALGWFAHRATGLRWAAALPAVVWFALMVIAIMPTTEKDFLLAGDNWVGVVMIVAGAITFGLVGYRLILMPTDRTDR